HEQARAGAALFDSSDRGKVEAAGPDAPAFLHNLCTNDVRGLPPDAGCEALFCTPTAKVVAHALVFRSPPEGRDERLRLDVAPGLSAMLLRHLDHYLISEQVELADRTPDFAQLHLAGPDAPAVLARAAGAAVDETTFAPEAGRKAISYTKGCYLGQEPIVMARDRGQVNRAFLGVKLPGGAVPPGSLLYREGKEVGRVTSSVVSPRLGPIGLAYVRRGHQAPGTLLEVDARGQRSPA